MSPDKPSTADVGEAGPPKPLDTVIVANLFRTFCQLFLRLDFLILDSFLVFCWKYDLTLKIDCLTY